LDGAVYVEKETRQAKSHVGCNDLHRGLQPVCGACNTNETLQLAHLKASYLEYRHVRLVVVRACCVRANEHDCALETYVVWLLANWGKRNRL